MGTPDLQWVSDFSSKLQSSTTTFHHKMLGCIICQTLLQLLVFMWTKISWDGNICNLICRKCQQNSHISDTKYHVTPHTIFSVLISYTNKYGMLMSIVGLPLSLRIIHMVEENLTIYLPIVFNSKCEYFGVYANDWRKNFHLIYGPHATCPLVW